MKIANNVEMLEITSMGPAIYLTLTWDESHLVLIDTGYPGQTNDVVQAISAAGFSAAQITHIILTHQDIDHVGCVADLLKLSPSAQVMAHVDEAPYIDGREMPFYLAELLESYDSLPDDSKELCDIMKDGFDNWKITIAQMLSDGDILPVCGGVEVIHTPGHTPGHISLFLRESGVLVCGDAVNIDNGKPIGPDPIYTQNMELGLRSMEKAMKYPVKAIVAYHGGYLSI